MHGCERDDAVGGTVSQVKSLMLYKSSVSLSVIIRLRQLHQSGLQKLCRYLDMGGCLHHKTYMAHVKRVAQATNTVTTCTLDDAARGVRRVYR